MFYLRKLKSKVNTFVFKMLSKINIKLLITLACFAFIGSSIYGNFESLSNQKITIHEILWFIWGIIFSFLSVIINAFAWLLLINNIGCKSEKLDIVKLFLATNIYKYLPGGIWHFVSRYKKLCLEFSNEKSIESILLEPLLMLVAGLFFIPFRGLNISLFILCWSSTLVFLPVFRQFIIQALKEKKFNIYASNDNLKDIKSVKSSHYTSLANHYPYKALFVEIIFVLFRFFGFICCMNAFSIGSLISQGELISSFSLAWVIGLIVPAAPGGLGVFESVILFRLGSHLPEAPLIAALLSYRLISTISDILAALIYPVKKVFKF